MIVRGMWWALMPLQCTNYYQQPDFSRAWSWKTCFILKQWHSQCNHNALIHHWLTHDLSLSQTARLLVPQPLVLPLRMRNPCSCPAYMRQACSPVKAPPSDSAYCAYTRHRGMQILGHLQGLCWHLCMQHDYVGRPRSLETVCAGKKYTILDCKFQIVVYASQVNARAETSHTLCS